MTAETEDSQGIRRVRLDADHWADVLARAGSTVAGSANGTGPIGTVSRHITAPVRARLVASAGSRGSVTRLSIVGSEVLMVLQATVARGGQTVVEPGAELRLCDPETLWDALQAGLPPSALVRAPAAVGYPTAPAKGGSVSGEAPVEPSSDRTMGVSDIPHPGAALVHDETAIAEESIGLLVTVEAWPTSAQPTAVWMRRWSVVDDALLDIRTSGGRITRTSRPAGSVAAELQWALAGAIGVVSGPRDDQVPSPKIA